MKATPAKKRSQSVLALCLVASLSLSQNAVAQDAPPAGGGGNVFDDTLSDLYLIGALGVGGAILGLSTLSFVDKPTKHLKNIFIGGAIGIIAGVGVVAWGQATKSKEDIYRDSNASAGGSPVGPAALMELGASDFQHSLASVPSPEETSAWGVPLFYTFDF